MHEQLPRAGWPCASLPDPRLLARLIQQRRVKAFVSFVAVSTVTLFLLYPLVHLEYVTRVSNPTLPPMAPMPTTDDRKPLSLPSEYDQGPPRGPICVERFSERYLEDFRDHAVAYCPSGSTGNITCFHTSKRKDGATDSMCFGSGVGWDAASNKFSLECEIRDLTAEEEGRKLVSFQRIKSYWYETGPPEVFSRGVSIVAPSKKASASLPLRARQEVPSGVEAETKDLDASPSPKVLKPPKNFLLLKREGEGNLWHCIMEIFSSWMSIDVLRMSADPSNNGQPFFKVPEDVPDTQVVILDDRKDGPYFDLWTLFARRKPLRLKDLAADPHMTEAIRDANIIVPLAGSSNPLWQDDWETEACDSVPTVSVFVRRVLDFYEIPEPPPRTAKDPIKVTFIDRTSSRRLLDQEAIFEELKKRVPHIKLEVVDFAAITFPEQLRLVRDTDVLVGVHGAGFTHALFMRQRAGAVVEILPETNDFHVFRNMALITGLDYYRVHAEQVIPSKGGSHRRDLEERDLEERDLEERDLEERDLEERDLEERDLEERDLEMRALGKRGDWHFEDVRLEADRFVDVVGAAVKSLYTNGVWDYDANEKKKGK